MRPSPAEPPIPFDRVARRPLSPLWRVLLKPRPELFGAAADPALEVAVAQEVERLARVAAAAGCELRPADEPEHAEPLA